MAACRAIPHFLFSKKLSGLVGKLQGKRQSKSSKTKTQGETKNKSKSSSKNEGGEKNEISKPSSKNQGGESKTKTKTKKIAAAVVRNTCGGAASSFVKMMDLRKKILTLRDLLDFSPCIGSASVNQLLIWTLKDLQTLYPNIKPTISRSKLDTASTYQILNCFCDFMKSLGDRWAEDTEWRSKFKYDGIKKLSQEDLERAAVELLDHINKVARERMFDMTYDDDDDDHSKVSTPPREIALSDYCSESEKTPISSSPCTPTSILTAGINFSRNGSSSYSPPRLLPLRVQAVEKLNPIDLKRLSFLMLSHMVPQDPNNLLQKKQIQTDHHHQQQEQVDVDFKNEEGEDSSIRSGESCLTFEMDEDMVGMQPLCSNNVKNFTMDGGVKLAQGGGLDVVPPPPSLTKVRSRVDLLFPPPTIGFSTPISPPMAVQESPLSTVEHPPLPNMLKSDQNIIPQSSETIVSVSTESTVSAVPPPPLPAEQTAESAVSTVPPPPPPPVTSSNKITLPTPPPPPPRLIPDKVATPPPPPPPLFVAKGTAPPPPPPPSSVQKGTTPPPPPPPIGGKNMAFPPPPPPMGGPSSGGVPAPPPPMLKGGGPPPPPGLGGAILAKKSITKLKRSSQMGNLYRVLKVKVEGSTTPEGKSARKGKIGAAPANGKQGMADALAEMTKRSSYFLQIEEDVKIHAQAIKELKVAIISFQTSDMAELLKFHKHVESHLERLADETQVLARFEDFPSKKLEALRMAAALFTKLDKIATTLKNWEMESPVNQLLTNVENYFNKIKGDIEALDRTKDEEAKRFQAQKINFDFNILVRIKELLVDVSSNCMELALKERREANAKENGESGNTTEGKKKVASTKTLWKAFQFAYRIYTFAGGHDERADRLTRELAHEIQTDPNN